MQWTFPLLAATLLRERSCPCPFFFLFLALSFVLVFSLAFSGSANHGKKIMSSVDALIAAELTSGGCLLDLPPCPICRTPLIRRAMDKKGEPFNPYCIKCEAELLVEGQDNGVPSETPSAATEESSQRRVEEAPPSCEGPSSTEFGRSTSASLGAYLLKGYCMTSTYCRVCNSPLMRKSENDDPFCVNSCGDSEALPSHEGGAVKASLKEAETTELTHYNDDDDDDDDDDEARAMVTALAEARAQRRKKEVHSGGGVGKLGERMLKGWAMLAESCDVCGTPKVGRRGVVECVNECDEEKKEDEGRGDGNGNGRESDGGEAHSHPFGKEEIDYYKRIGVSGLEGLDEGENEQDATASETNQVRDFWGSRTAESMGAALLKGWTMTSVVCAHCGTGVIMKNMEGAEVCFSCEKEEVLKEGHEEGGGDVDEDEEMLSAAEKIQKGLTTSASRAAGATRGGRTTLPAAVISAPHVSLSRCFSVVSLRLEQAATDLEQCSNEDVERNARRVKELALAMKAIKDV